MKPATREALGVTFAAVRRAPHFDSRSAFWPYSAVAASTPPFSAITARAMQCPSNESWRCFFLTEVVTCGTLPGRLHPVKPCQGCYRGGLLNQVPRPEAFLSWCKTQVAMYT